MDQGRYLGVVDVAGIDRVQCFVRLLEQVWRERGVSLLCIPRAAIWRPELGDDPDGPHDPDKLANWIAELAWFGLRGVRSDD